MEQLKILFLCHGNICRSPMAEFIMKDLVRSRGLQDYFLIDSATVTTEEIGNAIYPPAKRKLYEKGIPFDDHRARLITKKEIEDYYDMVFVMDTSNLWYLRRILGGEPGPKIRLMMECSGERRDVQDPWYTGDFETTYRDLVRACSDLLDSLKDRNVLE